MILQARYDNDTMEKKSGFLIDTVMYPYINRVRYNRERVSNFDLSESRKHCFLASDWLKFENLP